VDELGRVINPMIVDGMCRAESWQGVAQGAPGRGDLPEKRSAVTGSIMNYALPKRTTS